jgi:hypothetical protein
MDPRKQWRNTLEAHGEILQGGPGGMVVGLAGPTWQLLVLLFVPVPSSVFYSLLAYPSSRSSFVLFLN